MTKEIQRRQVEYKHLKKIAKTPVTNILGMKREYVEYKNVEEDTIKINSQQKYFFRNKMLRKVKSNSKNTIAVSLKMFSRKIKRKGKRIQNPNGKISRK